MHGRSESAFLGSRKPLVGEFQFKGQSLFIINNHLKSRREDQPLMGKNQPPHLTTEKIRILQAQAIQRFVKQMLSIDPKAKIIVLGDFNDFQFSKSVRNIESAGLTNLINKLPREERYTYIYQGNAQALDHILVSQGLASEAEIDIVHVNAEFVYTDGKRASDHDPVLARIKIE